MSNPSTTKNRRILVIDDNQSIHDDFHKILCPATDTARALEAEEALFGVPQDKVRQIQFEVESAYQGQAGVLLAQKALQTGLPYAVAFVDVRMPPGMDGIETAQKLWEMDPSLQIVLCTAYSDYSWAEMIEKLGERDGLLILKKPFDVVEALQLAQSLTEKWWLRQQYQRNVEELEGRVAERTRDLQESNRALKTEVSEHERAEEMLRQSEQHLRVQTTALDAAANTVVITDKDGNILWVNAAFTTLTGYTAQEVLGKNSSVLKCGKLDDALHRNLWQTISSGKVWNGELTNRRKDGSLYVEEVTITPLLNAHGAIERYIAVEQDITEWRQAENLARESENRYRSIFDNAHDAIFTIAPDGTFTSMNPAVEAIGGILRADWIGKSFLPMVHPDDVPLAQKMLSRVMRGESAPVHELRGNPNLKRPAILEITLAARKEESGKITSILGIGRDITERKHLEAKLFQSQKLETIGKLAGGVAHEFNSILTAILGQSEMLLADLPPGSPCSENAAQISQAASRAAALTRQLLAYGRKQFLKPETLDLNKVIAGMEGVFQLLVGGHVATQIVPAPNLPAVNADAGQIEQVIMNVVMNAREAMPNGGKLTLETASVSIDEESVGRYPELKPGDYVVLAITDTGAGMSEQVKARLFEPFFTTKAVGQGTGLGLSTCYGILKQTGGHISVYSESGRGTTFKIYLPQIEHQAKAPAERPAPLALPQGTETILLVEDDPALREMAGALLTRLGYKVFAAANGVEAMNLKQQRNVGHIDLLFTDVVMPHMSGKELADRVRSSHPHTRILFTSAYTEIANIQQGVLDQGAALLQKPYTPAALAQKLREILSANIQQPETK